MKLRYATPEDIEVCRQLHRQYGTTYYFSTLRFPREIRRRVHCLYGFVRVPDEWVDNPSGATVEETKSLLSEWRHQMREGFRGQCPKHPVMRAFCDVVSECQIPVSEAECFLDAMEMDLVKSRYANFEELQQYMRGSASAVGVMMCYAMGSAVNPKSLHAAMALGEAMQLTNFLRDIAEDLRRNRIYVPQDDLARFGITEEDLSNGRVTDAFKALMAFQINRARTLYAQSDKEIECLPRYARTAVLLARILYSRILNRIEDENYDVFSKRVRVSRWQKLACVVMLSLFGYRAPSDSNETLAHVS